MKTLKISIAVAFFGLMSFGVLPTTITWKSELINVGDIPQGIPKAINYEFTNTSEKPVLITNVQGSCGCTATDYTKDAVAPGKTGTIKATFNAASAGAFTKTVTVTTSADVTPKVLTFKGTVVANAKTN